MKICYFVILIFICGGTSVCATNNTTSPLVTLRFVRYLFRLPLEIMTNYTIQRCESTGKEFNVTDTEDRLKECLQTHLMPLVANRTAAYFNGTRHAVHKMPKMKSVANFVAYKAALQPICEVAPITLDCFTNETQPGIQQCWARDSKNVFFYMKNLIFRLCESETTTASISRLLTAKNMDCLQQYENVTKECIKKSHLKFRSPCGFVSCLLKSVQPCAIVTVDKFLTEFLLNFQDHSGCANHTYFFGINDPTNFTSTSTPSTTTTVEPTTVKLVTVTPKRVIRTDPCTILEERIESIFRYDRIHLFEFFAQLDLICEQWNATNCWPKSPWNLVLAQCQAQVNAIPSNRCVDVAMSERIDGMQIFCQNPAYVDVVDSWCRRHFSMAVNKDDLLKPCVNDPVPAARIADKAGLTLLWGVVALPVIIFGISYTIHFLTTRKKKESVTPDLDSDHSLVSSEGTKDSQTTNTSCSTV